jgi:hypothetical protein
MNRRFYIITGRVVGLSVPELRSKSEELARKLGLNYFKATDEWLSRW